jgi:predicted Na+-dependent transporter
METKNSLVTTIITICLIVLTATVVMTMNDNTSRNLYEGLILLGCVMAFTASVIMRESASKV